MTEATIKIEEMSCQHCVMRVKKAIEAVVGVTKSDVGSATIQFDESKTSEKDITSAIEKAGYKVIS